MMTSSSSVSSPDEMIASLPNSALPKITSEPHYKSLVELKDSLKDDYSSIPSSRGGGTYGYLGGLQSDAVYPLVAPETLFIIPPDPFQIITQTGTNSVTSGKLHRDHTEVAREFKEWVNLERAGKKQIDEAFIKTFLAGVFDCNRGLSHLQVRDIITHLFMEYGQVENQDRVGNWSKLLEPWDTNRPFQELVKWVQEIQEFRNYGRADHFQRRYCRHDGVQHGPILQWLWQVGLQAMWQNTLGKLPGALPGSAAKVQQKEKIIASRGRIPQMLGKHWRDTKRGAPFQCSQEWGAPPSSAPQNQTSTSTWNSTSYT